MLDRLVEDVRLVAAAARAGDLPELRDFAAEDFLAELREGAFVALRAEVFLAAERAEVFAPPRAALERAEVERADVVRLAADFLAVLRAVDFAAERAGAFFAAEREVDFAAVFLAPVLEAVLREAVLAADFLAVLRAVDFAAERAGAFFAAEREVDFAAVFLAPVLEAVLREAVLAADFLAVPRAVDFAAERAGAFFAAEREVDFAAVFLAEPRRALLFFDLVLVAPESPVNNIVSGLDLSSVGIAASFKGLRVQPSRFEGNVVIPSGFRLTESVESKSGTFSVDTFHQVLLSGLRTEGGM